MKSTVVDESLSSFKPMYCSREYQASTRLIQQYEKSTLNYTAVIQLYDNFATVSMQLLQVTILNLPNLETQLFQLYVEVTGIMHDFMPEEDDEMPPLEDITNGES